MQGYQKVNGQTGYDIAADIDDQLNKLLEMNGPSPETYMTWLRVARTFRTSCDMIEEGCRRFKNG